MHNNEFLTKCAFVLFLNKKDILEHKIKHVEFRKYFPMYKGEDVGRKAGPLPVLGKNTFEEVRDYTRSRYFDEEEKEREEEQRHDYIHYTNATDKNNIGKHIFMTR